MDIQLIDYTGKGSPDPARYAAELLVFTKSTRLNMTPDLRENIAAMTDDELHKELEYMTTTIRSSWEFLHFTFLVRDVSRAFAQQLTRTRTGSYAMQSQRVTDVSGANVVNPHPAGLAPSDLRNDFTVKAAKSVGAYKAHLSEGADTQDARGLLPMNIECNLVASFNLRALADLLVARKSLRVQGEYRDFVSRVELLVTQTMPWTKSFFESKNKKAIDILSEVVKEIGLEVGDGPGWKIAKAIDLIR